MPHVIVKLRSGRSEEQKARIAEGVTKSIMATTGNTEDAVSVSIEDIDGSEWKEKVYNTDILHGPGKLYKRPGY